MCGVESLAARRFPRSCGLRARYPVSERRRKCLLSEGTPNTHLGVFFVERGLFRHRRLCVDFHNTQTSASEGAARVGFVRSSPLIRWTGTQRQMNQTAI